MSKAKALDQFFTTPEVASEACETLYPILDILGYKNYSFLEPSAGGGSFIDAASKSLVKTYAFDIDPKRDDVYYADFLSDNIAEHLPPREELVVIGNPPFGKRSKLAIDFINHSFQYSDTVAFILPIQFIKYLTQRRIDHNAKLVHNEQIQDESFTFEGKPYSVRSVFQIWTLKSINKDKLSDYRTRQAPPTRHDDFEMYSYNCTPQTLHMFDKDWDFAVLRQGWDDMSPINKSRKHDLDTRKQWMFFKGKDAEATRNLKSIDYNKLSERNTSVRGFGKADVVEEYRKHFPDRNIHDEKTLW